MSRSTVLRTGVQLFFAGITRPHAFYPKLKLRAEFSLRQAKKERHLEECSLPGCLLQVTQNRKPGTGQFSNYKDHNFAEVSVGPQCFDRITDVSRANDGKPTLGENSTYALSVGVVVVNEEHAIH
jgi:hypothetical protein